MRKWLIPCAIALIPLAAAPAGAQFRRGILSTTEEVTLFPVRPPAALLPAGAIRVEVRNVTSAPARIADRLAEALERQVLDNDDRLSRDADGPPVTILATLTEWKRTERNGTKYVADKRQVGTRQVTDKNGTRRTEPVYEYGRNERTVINEGAVAVRIQVRPAAGRDTMVDETTRHTYFNEELVTQGGPTDETVENELIDTVARRSAARVSPGREAVRVLLARSDAVDRLNAMATSRRWNEWLETLMALKPHRDARQDAYRLHNIAVAYEARAYETADMSVALEAIGQARRLSQQFLNARPDEKYFVEARDRIDTSARGYERLAAMFDLPSGGARTDAPAPAPRPQAPPPPAPRTGSPSESTGAAAAAPEGARAMTNRDVLDLRAIGVADDNVIAAIRQAPDTAFDLSAAGIKALESAKVPAGVIAAMRARTR
jgi:hypothetical protein